MCVLHTTLNNIYYLKCLVVFSLCTVVSVFTSVVSSPFNYEHFVVFHSCGLTQQACVNILVIIHDVILHLCSSP